MPVRVRCPNCGLYIKADDSLFNHEVACSSCGRHFKLNRRDAPPAWVDGWIVRCPKCGETWEFDQDVRDEIVACPNCREQFLVQEPDAGGTPERAQVGQGASHSSEQELEAERLLQQAVTAIHTQKKSKVAQFVCYMLIGTGVGLAGCIYLCAREFCIAIAIWYLGAALIAAAFGLMRLYESRAPRKKQPHKTTALAPEPNQASGVALASAATITALDGDSAGQARAPVPQEQGVVIVDRRPMWRRPVSATIGRLNAASTALVLGTTAPFRRGPCLADNAVQRVAAGFRDADTADRLELQLGSSMPLRNLIRIWKRRGIGIIGKILGTLMWPFLETIKAMGRVDCYDPFAHSVALYHNDPAILAHELGHAQDFASHRWRILYSLCRAIPLVMLYQEWKASRLGIRNLQSRGLDGDINRANRVMGGGFGSYVGAIVLELIVPGFGILIGAILGQVIGALAKPFGRQATFPLAGAPKLSSVEAIALGAAIPGRPVSLPPPLAPAPTTQAKLDALTAAVQAQRDTLARTMRGQAMGKLKFICPHCKQHLEVPGEMLGKPVKCPTCHGHMTLPELPAGPQALEVVTPLSPPLPRDTYAEMSLKPEPLFLYIPVIRLILMSIASFSLYDFYWIYKNWRYVKERDKLHIRPFWRGWFGIFYCHSLLRRIYKDKEARSFQMPSFSPGGLATGWVLLMFVGYVVGRAPGFAATIVSALIPSFLCLVPVQNYVNSVTQRRSPGLRYYGWSSGHIVCLVIGLLVWALVLVALIAEMGL